VELVATVMVIMVLVLVTTSNTQDTTRMEQCLLQRKMEKIELSYHIFRVSGLMISIKDS
jgi:hypothetical protein